MSRRVVIDYTNWRGIRRLRCIEPRGIQFKSTKHHPEPQWLMVAIDREDGKQKDFAIKDIHCWEPA